MPQDLSKVKEVLSLVRSDVVNDRLATGNWVLLEVKITEDSNRSELGGGEYYVRKYSQTVYVIGRVK